MIIFYLSKNNPYVAELRLIIKFYTTMNHSNTIQTILIAFALYSCTSNDYEKLAWNVAKKQSNNELTKFLNHYKDDKNPQKYEAACYLVAYIPQKLSLKNNVISYDIDAVQADSLIFTLEESFKIKDSSPFLKQYSFEQFLEYILPYRISNEPMEFYWKTDCKKYYFSQGTNDIIKAAEEINSQVQLNLSPQFYGDNLKSYSTLMKDGYGKCDDRTNLLTMALRANGIPAAYEFVPNWGSSNNGHSFVSIILPDGKIHSLQNTDKITGDSYLSRKTPKIYRKTYKYTNEDNISESLPELFRQEDVLDVTELHAIGHNNVNLSIKSKNSKYVYLSVFTTSTWKVVAQSTTGKFLNVGTGTRFTSDDNLFEGVNLGNGIVYLPVEFTNQNIKPIGHPIIVSDSCITEIIPNTTEKETVILYRKYPLNNRIVNFARSMVYGYFEAANKADFSDAREVYRIINIPESRLQNIKIQLDKPYRYVRYVRPRGTFSIAEFALLDENGEHINFKPIACNAIMEDKDMMKIFDSNPLSYYEVNGGVDLWIGADMKKAKKIQFLQFAPRNDDNAISPKDCYELFYWNDKWISLGQKVASDFCIQFDNVPKDALLWLKDLTKGHEERPFTIKNGKQIWW